MKFEWKPTDDYYDAIISAPDLATRQDLYRQYFIQPWQAMMIMFGGDSEDEFAGARQWAWYLPDQLTETPASLMALKQVGAWQKGHDALAKAVACFEPYQDKIGMDHVTGWLTLADPERSDPIGRGYTGAIDFTSPQFVVQYDMPNDYNIPRLSGAVVHEFNHLVRLRVFPWDMMKTSVADYIIHEGMAESFAAELFGEDVVGYYVTEIDEAGLETAKQLIGNGLDKTGFNVIRGYIFGDSLAEKWGFDTVGMPDYGGYAIGYRVVQAYLKKTGKSVVEATFVSANEIIEQSGYFD